jgi:hypothetical protein
MAGPPRRERAPVSHVTWRARAGYGNYLGRRTAVHLCAHAPVGCAPAHAVNRLCLRAGKRGRSARLAAGTRVL